LKSAVYYVEVSKMNTNYGSQQHHIYTYNYCKPFSPLLLLLRFRS